MTSKKSCRTNIIALLYVFLHVSPTLIGDTTAACVMPPTFGSFTGRPASTLNDCFWDFSQCTHKSDLPCCQNRFDKCCLHIMPPPTPIPQDPPPTRPPTKKSTTMAPCQNRVRQHAGNLIGCVWQFNNCIEEKYKCRHSEDICYQRFDDCKMLVMGMMPMSDQNFVNELPAPFMSIEQTTTTTTTTTTSTTTTTTPRPITSAARRTPTLANCLWSFFRCNGSKCNQNWDNCMSAAMGSMNP